jgi:hypothetical protein
MLTRIQFTWTNREDGGRYDLTVEWPSVPRVGEYVCIDDETGEGYTVHAVLWRADGSAQVRLR